MVFGTTRNNCVQCTEKREFEHNIRRSSKSSTDNKHETNRFRSLDLQKKEKIHMSAETKKWRTVLRRK